MTGRLPRHLLPSLMLIACTLTTGAAQTAESPCPLEPIGSGSVVSVVDGRSFLLDDGREVRLAGLQIPAPASAGDKDDSAGQAAKAALESLLAGQVVTLKAPKLASDRYGRIVAGVQKILYALKIVLPS